MTYFDHMEEVPLCDDYPTMSNRKKHKTILNFIVMNQSIQRTSQIEVGNWGHYAE